jgi:hypothetical protein
MREEIKTFAYTCDDQKCQARILMETDELPDGYHGDVTEVNSSGGHGADWFACRATHIRAAIEGALTRDQREREAELRLSRFIDILGLYPPRRHPMSDQIPAEIQAAEVVGSDTTGYFVRGHEAAVNTHGLGTSPEDARQRAFTAWQATPPLKIQLREGDRVSFSAMRDPLNGDETLVEITGTVSRVWTNGKYVTILTHVACACCDKPRTFVRCISAVSLISSVQETS